MGYLGAGILLFAVVGGAGGPQNTKPAIADPTPTPVSVSASPILTQVTSDEWTTTIYLNSDVLCPVPSFELVTTDPAHDITAAASDIKYQAPGQKAFVPHPGCKPSSQPLLQVTLTFDGLAGSPVAAAVVVTPRQPAAAPVQIAVTVHRRVTSWEYAWVPLLSGVGLALAFVLYMAFAGLPDPDNNDDDQPDRLKGDRFWRKPLYAASAWTFGGSLATNITAAAAVVATVLTASGTVSELFPGVELGRFSLLIAAAGAVTAVAPLVFAALNYRFTEVDPTTAGVSVLTLPTGPVAVMRGRTKAALLGWLVPSFRSGGQVVALDSDTDYVRSGRGGKITIRSGPKLLAGGRTEPSRKAILPEAGPPRLEATITVPAGATVTLWGGGGITRDETTADPGPLPPWHNAKLKPGITLNVPPGATLTVSAAPAGSGKPVLALPGGTDIAVTAGQFLAVPAGLSIAAADVTLDGPPRTATYFTLDQDARVAVNGGAKISFLGRASLWLPAGTRAAAPGSDQDHPAKSTYLTVSTTFPLPHTGQVIAARMWSLLFASALTLLGTGAELGILGVLSLGLAAADLFVRVLCVVAAGVLGLIVFLYSVTSIRALADPAPGDALNATGGTAFML
jgi:hypothetical protein